MSFGWIPLATIRDPPFRTNLPVTLRMKESPATPFSVTVLPLRTTSFTHTTVGAVPPPVALMVVALLMLGRLIADALAVAARRRAGVVVAVRAGRAVRRRHVRLHAHREVGIGRADLAARERAHVAVRIRARRAHLRCALAAGRVAAPVALIGTR